MPPTVWKSWEGVSLMPPTVWKSWEGVSLIQAREWMMHVRPSGVSLLCGFRDREDGVEV